MYRIKYLNNLTKEISTPSDKSISHRAAIISSLCCEKTTITPFLHSEDTSATLDCLKKLGVNIQEKEDSLTINGSGIYFSNNKKVTLCARESGTTIRILSGLLVAQNFSVEFEAEKTLNTRPMDRIINPLKKMNANIKGKGFSVNLFNSEPITCPPLSISPSKEGIIGGEFNLKIASAQVKTAIIFASLYANSPVFIREPYQSRDHTERMLRLFKANLDIKEGVIISKPTPQLTSPKELYIPSDFSSAAFFIVLGLILKNTELTLKNVNINPTRCGLLKVLKRMGANIEIINKNNGYEPYADIKVKSSFLQSAVIEADEIPSMIDEIPILCVAACFARGRTLIQGTNELKVKETDRVKAISENLTASGIKVNTDTDDEIMIEGESEPKPAHFMSFKDHRTAMSAIILGAAIGSNCTIDDIQCINKSFPQFISLFESL